MDKKDILVRRNCFEFSAIHNLRIRYFDNEGAATEHIRKRFFFKLGGKFSFTHGI